MYRRLDGADVGDRPIDVARAEESYDVFDLTGSWNVSDRTAIRFGIENLV